MKTKAYVVIHHLKALSLSIFRRPSKNIFNKGPVYKLHLKISALYEHLPLKVQGLSKELSLSCSVLGKRSVRIDFAIHNSFKVKCAKNWYRDVSSRVLRTLKGFCMAKSAVDSDVKIVLSKYGFIGVGSFANI